eukprot:TRINITY_DN19773_c0_g2_i1.p1 TRINITY_DN19773_c0_g2~~TRINITY_DN19773_c0_g2_i1.p1  ORF type:complete len:294 (-),score=55.83 TRINITY_DN19773_c0_g2_i1:24-905(-)
MPRAARAHDSDDSMPESSSSENDAESWGDHEERAMQAFESQLDRLCPATGAIGSNALKADSRRSSDADQLPKQPASAASSSAVVHSPPSWPPSQPQAPEVPQNGVSVTDSSMLRSAFEADAGDDSVPSAMSRLQAICLQEPYRPEDHIMTAEEMWADSSAEEQEEQSRARAEDEPLSAAEMWGCDSEDEGSPALNPSRQAIARVANAQRVAAPSSVPEAPPPLSERAGEVAPSDSADALRLRRILAGDAAQGLLGGLTIEELDAVADDCERAVETLRWVLRRQRELASSNRRR